VALNYFSAIETGQVFIAETRSWNKAGAIIIAHNLRHIHKSVFAKPMTSNDGIISSFKFPQLGEA
jgi:hypothetical protein